MPFTSEPMQIEGVFLVKPRRFTDSRGYFVETYSRRPLQDFGITDEFVQDNEAMSDQTGTLRGLHFQVAPDPQAKLVRVIRGSVFDVVVDLRAGSPSYGRWCGATLTAAAGEQIYVPVGFAHAYCTLEPATLIAYKVTGYYNKTAEVGIRWDDPDVGIDWPIARDTIMVSDKDAALPRLRDLPTPLRFES